MRLPSIHRPLAVAVLLGGFVCTNLLLWGCQSTSEKPAATGGTTAGAKSASAAPTGEAAKGGAQLWGENCSRCHNIRDPGEYSDAQWDVVVHHMRLRAPLTAIEYRKILEFLKSANKPTL